MTDRHPLIDKLLGTTCLVWAAAGVLVPIALAVLDVRSVTALSLALFAAVVVLSRAMGRMEISIGNGNITICPDFQPILISIIFLPLWEAAVAGFISAFLLNRGHTETRNTWYNAANASLTVVVAGSLAHAISPLPPSPTMLLAVAATIAVVDQVVNAIGFLVFLEYRKPGKGVVMARQVHAVIASQILLNLFVLLLVVQFRNAPWWGLAVFAGFQAVVYAGTYIANSEQVQRRRSELLHDTFSRYVPANVVGELVGNDMHIELGGQQREVTVLFCDIRGFTSWSENREAVEIITELNTLLSELSAAVIEHEGTLDKFTGDGLMAFWGAPLPTVDHAAQACAAALEMLTRLDTLNHDRIQNGSEPFAIGVGVHSGLAVVGNVGHEQRLDYTAIGDTVNLAARLEAATKEIGSVLLVSAATHERLPTGLRNRAMRIGEISVKGRRQAVEVYALQPRRPGLEGLVDPDEERRQVSRPEFESFLQDSGDVSPAWDEETGGFTLEWDEGPEPDADDALAA